MRDALELEKVLDRIELLLPEHDGAGWRWSTRRKFQEWRADMDYWAPETRWHHATEWFTRHLPNPDAADAPGWAREVRDIFVGRKP